MNERNFRIETAQPEKPLKKIAEEETAKAINPDMRIKELTDKYNALMASYLEAEESSPKLAEAFLRDANLVLSELNAINSKQPVPNMEELKIKADELTKRKLNGKPS